MGKRLLVRISGILGEMSITEISPSGEYLKVDGQWTGVKDFEMTHEVLEALTPNEVKVIK